MNSTRVADFQLEDWLPRWLPPDFLIGGLAALAVLVAFYAVWQALRLYDPFERRFAQISQRRESLKREALDSKRQRRSVNSSGMMNSLVARLNLLRSKRIFKNAQWIDRMFAAHFTVFAARRAFASDGSRIEINSAMIPITTSSSTSVKPLRRRMFPATGFPRLDDTAARKKPMCDRIISGVGQQC